MQTSSDKEIKMKHLVYATTNPGKFAEVEKIFALHGIKIMSLRDFNIVQDVEETGSTLEENASLKVIGYRPLLPSGSIVIADDTGVAIHALGGEPGIKVRRWKGYKMTDEEIITHCLKRMKDVPVGKRDAEFRTVLAVSDDGSEIKLFTGILAGEILTHPLDQRREGMPFWSLFYNPELKMTLGEMHTQSAEFLVAQPTHREKAVLKALPYLKSLLRQTPQV